MTPVVFDGCFGWLHDARGDTGVVLCNPYGHEAVWAHRSWRGLAEAIASGGMPALRFDYLGTGDSDQSEDDGERVSAWVDSIVHAVEYFRKITGVRRVVLCGLRLGGSLAALAAQRLGDIDGLILMAPVEVGKSYLRELKLIHRRWRNTSAPHIETAAPMEGEIETLGYRLNTETAKRIEAMSLLNDAIVLNVPQILILDPVKVSASDKVRACFERMGAQVAVQELTDYVHLLSDSIAASEPTESYTRVSDWVVQLDAAASVHVPQETACPVVKGVEETVPQLIGDGFVETPVIFGEGQLFGVYCQPVSRVSAPEGAPSFVSSQSAYLVEADASAHVMAGSQAVLFPNTARSHHVGEARMWVTQARALAKQGIASLRMDVGLLGDSASAPISVSIADLHAPQSVADVAAGIDWLVAAGHVRPTAVGICSGSYLTFHAAASHPAVAGVTLINQREYYWAEGREEAVGLAVAATTVYMQSIRSLDKWRRVFAGEIPIGAIAGALLKRRLKKWKEKAVYLMSAVIGMESATRIVRKQFETLNQRGVDVRIVYGDFDEGLELNAAFLGKDFSSIAGLRNVTAETNASMDHALFLYPARAVMMQMVERQLSDQMARQSEAELSSASSGPRTVSASPLGPKLSVLTHHAGVSAAS